jgi:putative glutathione S-transferase
VFEALDVLEMRLAKTRFLFPGANLTLADVRLFTTLIRFDPVYFVHFKCCRRALTSYTSLWAFARDIYNLPGIRSTIDMEDARYHYFSSHETVNPFRIVPIPTLITYEVPQERKLLP